MTLLVSSGGFCSFVPPPPLFLVGAEFWWDFLEYTKDCPLLFHFFGFALEDDAVERSGHEVEVAFARAWQPWLQVWCTRSEERGLVQVPVAVFAVK